MRAMFGGASLAAIFAAAVASAGAIVFPHPAPRPDYGRRHRRNLTKAQRAEISVERGRLTRKARRGYLATVTKVDNPDRYLNSHARDMKALRRVLELQAARASL